MVNLRFFMSSLCVEVFVYWSKTLRDYQIIRTHVFCLRVECKEKHIYLHLKLINLSWFFLKNFFIAERKDSSSDGRLLDCSPISRQHSGYPPQDGQGARGPDDRRIQERHEGEDQRWQQDLRLIQSVTGIWTNYTWLNLLMVIFFWCYWREQHFWGLWGHEQKLA